MVQTDNSFFADKVALRAGHLPTKTDRISVLDCFGGGGLVWSAVSSSTGRNINRISIEIKDDHGVGFHLPGNNMSFLPSMNIDKFDVIDLDAYGVPYDQLSVIFKRNYRGIVFVTFIQSVVGSLPRLMLVENGFTKEMIKNIPTLFFRNGWEYFKNFLALHGVGEVWHRHHHRKHYLGFMLD